jgi:membrane associated rhomboid family serine protease
MGYQDREYYQEDRPAGYQLGGDLSYTWRLVIVCCGVFLANLFLFQNATKNLVDYLALHGDTLRNPLSWYQLLTYGFVHNKENLGHLFWNMVGLVIFGSSIEQAYGRREYLRFYLGAILLGGLAFALRTFIGYGYDLAALQGAGQADQVPVYGAQGAITALALLFCLRNPFATIMLMMVLPVPAWVLGMVIIVGNILLPVAGGTSVGNAIDLHLAGALFAVAYFYFEWNLTRTFSFSWLSRMGTTVSRLARPRPKLKVFDDADEDDDNAYRELEAEADRILAKISHDGESSLTRQERTTLERYSRLMRQKHR